MSPVLAFDRYWPLILIMRRNSSHELISSGMLAPTRLLFFSKIVATHPFWVEKHKVIMETLADDVS